MKKTTAFALICTIVLTLTACNDNETPTAPESTAETTATSGTPATSHTTADLPPEVTPQPTKLHVSSELFMLGINENGELYNETGGCSFSDYQVWGEDEFLWVGSDLNDSPYNITEINYVLGERIYAGTEIGSSFWNELYKQGGQEKVSEVMMLGHNYLDDARDKFFYSAPMSEEIQLPPLYRLLHYYEISVEVFTRYNGEGSRWYNRSPEFLRTMFLPKEEMKAALLNEKGAIFNGTVHNILTLNELFETDRDAFAQIDLQELVQFQQNLESVGIERGFNADMVTFANEHNVNSAIATS